MSRPSENHAEQQIRKLAAELYDKALAEGEHFTVAELSERLVTDLMRRFADNGRNAVRDLIEISARHAVGYIDKQRTKPNEQAALFDDLDSAIAVGESARRARRRMNNGDWVRHLTYIADNAARVNARAARESRRYSALAPYLMQGVDTEAALIAWQADHPEEVLP